MLDWLVETLGQVKLTIVFTTNIFRLVSQSQAHLSSFMNTNKFNNLDVFVGLHAFAKSPPEVSIFASKDEIATHDHM